MRIDAIPVGKNPPEEINVIIEVPVGGEPIKYELDKDAGAMFVDRFLYTPMRYPGIMGLSRTPCRTMAILSMLWLPIPARSCPARCSPAALSACSS